MVTWGMSQPVTELLSLVVPCETRTNTQVGAVGYSELPGQLLLRRFGFITGIMSTAR